jgi:N-acetylglucosaminyl-diphospho-decaprenol L-rhamnosyltransferase
MERVRVSVIVPAWNASAVLGRCLDSLAGQRVEGGFETIVVDNASTDDTPELLRRYSDHLRVITNDHNARFSGANNQAALEARGDVLFFLNSDTELLAPDVLERLARAVADPQVGVAGPMLVNPDGSLQPSCAAYPSVSRALLVGVGLHRLAPGVVLERIAPEFWSHDRSIDTGWLMGAAIAVRAGVFRDLGGFWSTVYGEEQDFAYRARARGLLVRFESAAKVMHIGNHSLSQKWSDAERAAQVANAELLFLRTHYGRARAATIRVIVTTAYSVRWLVHSLLGRREQAGVYRAMAGVYTSARPVSWKS